MKCERCGGKGTVDKCLNCNHDTHDRYVNECYKQVQCRQCDGWGYLGYEPQALASFIQVIANTHQDKHMRIEAVKWLKRITNKYK